MTKGERLKIEETACAAVGRLLHCRPQRKRTTFGTNGPTHEFDIYLENVVVGGVSTSTAKTSGGNSNTGGIDRACSELLWLTLWPGKERRIHVLTDRDLAQKLVDRFRGANFPSTITIYQYRPQADLLVEIGTVGV